MASLQQQQAASGAELNAKFALEGSFEMALGDLKTFFAGLEGLVGAPKVVPTLMTAMAREHCEAADANEPFSTSNGVEGTTSAAEWSFVVDPKPQPTEATLAPLVRAQDALRAALPPPAVESRVMVTRLGMRRTRHMHAAV